MSVKPIPDGYHSVTPYLIVDGAAEALGFYAKAFNATEVMRFEVEGKIMHSEFKIGDSIVMMADEFPPNDIKGPKAFGGSPMWLAVYVENVDAMFQQALDAGATEKMPLVDQFYGDRSGSVEDPFGHSWTLMTHKEDLTEEEINARFEAMMAQGGPPCE